MEIAGEGWREAKRRSERSRASVQAGVGEIKKRNVKSCALQEGCESQNAARAGLGETTNSSRAPSRPDSRPPSSLLTRPQTKELAKCTTKPGRAAPREAFYARVNKTLSALEGFAKNLESDLLPACKNLPPAAAAKASQVDAVRMAREKVTGKLTVRRK